MQFGRKSEKLDRQIEQFEMQLEVLQADESEAEREMPSADQEPRKKSVLRPLPDHVLRDEKIYALPANACLDCDAIVQAPLAPSRSIERGIAAESPHSLCALKVEVKRPRRVSVLDLCRRGPCWVGHDVGP